MLRAATTLLFERPTGYSTPVLTSLFGTTRPVTLGMGMEDMRGLRKVGHVLASSRGPEPPKGLKDAGHQFQMVKSA